MNVGDEDLSFLRDVMHGESDADQCDQSAELVDAVIAELRALRAVANAGLALVKAMDGIDCNCADQSCIPFVAALRATGRLP